MSPDYFGRIGQYCLSFEGEDVDVVIDRLEEAYRQRKRIYLFGNGGSGATASHFGQDLGKGTLLSPTDVRRFKVLSLTDNVPNLLAWANDAGYETVFEQQLRNLADEQDLAIAISSSGNSENVLQAVRFANSLNMVTIGMTGFDGGQLRRIVNHCIHIPIHDAGTVESIHLIIAHYIVRSLRDRLPQ